MRLHPAAFAFSLSIFFHTTFAQPAARVYAVQYAEGGPIYSCALDGTDLRSFRLSGRPRVIAVDWTSSPQKLYIGTVSTSGAGKIIRCNTDGTDTADVVTGLIGINDIELDLTHRKVYWLQNTYQDDRIFHADMDGLNSDVTQIYATTVSTRELWGLALDVTNQRLWITERGSTCYASYLRRMTFSGGSITTLRFPICNPHDIEYFAGRIYWWEEDAIYSANGDGTDLDTIFSVSALMRLAVNGTDGSVYWADFTNYGIRRVQADGTGDTIVISGRGALESLEIDYNPSAVPVDPSPALPTACELSECYPNPFNAGAMIEVRLPAASAVRLTVHDLLGRETVVLLDERREAGVHRIAVDGSALASGVYFCRLQVDGMARTRRLLLVR